MGKHYYRGHRGLFRVHLFSCFCRIVFVGCWKEETVSIKILVGKTQISLHLLFELFATVLLYQRSSRVQGFMSRSRHIVTSQRVYGCFRKWVDTRRNVSMEWKTPPLLDGYVTALTASPWRQNSETRNTNRQVRLCQNLHPVVIGSGQWTTPFTSKLTLRRKKLT